MTGKKCFAAHYNQWKNIFSTPDYHFGQDCVDYCPQCHHIVCTNFHNSGKKTFQGVFSIEEYMRRPMYAWEREKVEKIQKGRKNGSN